MRGRTPKSAELRQRRNKETSAAILSGSAIGSAPSLPRGMQWHQQTLADWRRWWKSPMSSRWLDGDMPALLRLIDLVNRYWWARQNQIDGLRASGSAFRLVTAAVEWADGKATDPVLGALVKTMAATLVDLTKVTQKLTLQVGAGQVGLAAEIRQEETRFGLTPIDRRRLQWEVEEPDQTPTPMQPEEPGQDPRAALRLVQ